MNGLVQACPHKVRSLSNLASSNSYKVTPISIQGFTLKMLGIEKSTLWQRNLSHKTIFGASLHIIKLARGLKKSLGS